MKRSAINPIGLGAANWKPVDRWAGRLPHRVMLNEWPEFALKNYERHPVDNRPKLDDDPSPWSGPFLLRPTVSFMEWVDQFHIGACEIIFWFDLLEAKHCAANDVDYLDAWSIGFERENDAVLFKLRWM
jgi:hypothetical protein